MWHKSQSNPNTVIIIIGTYFSSSLLQIANKLLLQIQLFAETLLDPGMEPCLSTQRFSFDPQFLYFVYQSVCLPGLVLEFQFILVILLEDKFDFFGELFVIKREYSWWVLLFFISLILDPILAKSLALSARISAFLRLATSFSSSWTLPIWRLILSWASSFFFCGLNIRFWGNSIDWSLIANNVSLKATSIVNVM